MKQVDPAEGTQEEELTLESGSRLSRWSQRKQASRTAHNEAGKPVVATGLDAEPEEPESRPLTDEEMPPLESLTEESDYRGFLSPKVSDELRKLALRKLFHGSKFNICDGLDDYDEDFTSFAKLGDVVTAEMRHRAEMEALKKMQQQGGTDPQVVEDAPVSDGQGNVNAAVEGKSSPIEEPAAGDVEIQEQAQTDFEAELKNQA